MEEIYDQYRIGGDGVGDHDNVSLERLFFSLLKLISTLGVFALLGSLMSGPEAS